MKSLLFALLLICVAAPLSTAQDQQVRLDIVDFFGASGIDLAALHSAMPVHVGSTFMLEGRKAVKEQIRQAVAKVTGHDPTDTPLVCCTDKGGWMFYIGLQGKLYRPFAYNAPPTGGDKLPQEGLDAYKKATDALQHAVQSGQSQEDDSKGYALTSDPAEHAAELGMRAYAVQHEDEIRQALAHSSDAASRQAASELLGYANQSQTQIDALVAASRDEDGNVRNNAVRALAVLASSSKAVAAKIPPDNFIAMLNSGTWTDRNKGGFLLDGLTVSRDPKILHAIDTGARDSLIEMSRWHETGHAYEYRILLGRIAGIEENRLQTLANDGAQVETIISALPQQK